MGYDFGVMVRIKDFVLGMMIWMLLQGGVDYIVGHVYVGRVTTSF